ncbi:MAG: DUF4162 domain-containing protein, partial [Candidatus Bathyarchaeia archaeon]
LEVEDPAFGSKVLEAIKGLDVVSDIIMGGNEVNIVSRDAEHSLPEIMDILRLNGVSVRRVSITKPTLDDVFLKYAGVRLEPVAAGRISEVRHVRSMIRRG